MTIENAQIESTMLGVEDHDTMSIWLYLKYDGAGQGFGGYALDDRGEKEIGSKRKPTVLVGLWVARILDVVGVTSWEKLPGKHIRVDREHHRVNGIGNILADRWFYPVSEMKGYIEDEEAG